MKTSASVDTAGLGLSALCIIHCLFLPLIGTSLPLVGAWSEIEWLHKVFVILAVPVGLSLIFSNVRYLFKGFALIGLGLLFAAAFIPLFHEIEAGVTVAGAMLLGFAHALRLKRRHHSH